MFANFESLANGPVGCLCDQEEQEPRGDRRQVEPAYSREDLIDHLPDWREDRLGNLVHDDVYRVADVFHNPRQNDPDEDGDRKDITEDLDE